MFQSPLWTVLLIYLVLNAAVTIFYTMWFWKKCGEYAFDDLWRGGEPVGVSFLIVCGYFLTLIPALAFGSLIAAVIVVIQKIFIKKKRIEAPILKSKISER